MKKIVMTGATSGLGVEWLYELDRLLDAEFFILARNKAKFDSLIHNRPLRNKFEFITCDFNSIASINASVELITSFTDSVDLLINNAGVWANNHIEYSKDKIELTLAVNQVAPYILTGTLLPLLNTSPQAAVINTASFRHSDAKIELNDIQLTSHYNAEQAYCNSKLYSILFTKQLAKKLEHTNISTVCFDPGIVDTPMLKTGFPKKLMWLYPMFRKLIARSPLKGAETGIYLSTNGNLKAFSGNYFKNKKVKNTHKVADNKSLETWLWCETEKITGYKYPDLASST